MTDGDAASLATQQSAPPSHRQGPQAAVAPSASGFFKQQQQQHNTTANVIDAQVISDALREIPADLDAATATPAAVCSHMITLRRLAAKLSSTANKGSRTSLHVLKIFVLYKLPLLMQPPPGKSPVNEKAAEDAAFAPVNLAELDDVDGDDVSGTTRLVSSGLGRNREGFSIDVTVNPSRCGVGTVPWTTEVAQLTLLCGAVVGVVHPHAWATQSALDFLLYDARQREAAGRSATAATAAEWSVDKERLTSTSSFAVALLQSMQTMRRRRELMEGVVGPAAQRLQRRIKETRQAAEVERGAVGGESGAAEACGGATTYEVESSLVPSKEKMKDLETYVYAYLLPGLLDDLRHFCEEMERRYDAAAPAATSATSATLHADSLCRMSVLETDIFAALISVFSQALLTHSVRSGSGDGTLFFSAVDDRNANDSAAGAAAAQSHEQRRQVRQLPLRAYTIALASIATTLEDTVGQTSGMVERTVGRFWRLQSDASEPERGAANETAPYRAWSSRHRNLNAALPMQAARGAAAAAAPSHRFQQRHAPRGAEVPAASAEESRRVPARSASAPPPRSGATDSKDRLARPPRPGRVGRPNFNAQNLIQILRFCVHDHALQLLMEPVGFRMGGDNATRYVESSAALASCVTAIAQAHWSLFETALYWAPLLRTYQLSFLVQAVASTWRNTVPAAADSASSSSSSSPTPSALTLDRAVGERVAEMLLRCYPDPAALQSLFGHLARAALRYADKQMSTAFASTVAAFRRLAEQWPPAFEGDAGAASGAVGGALPQYPVLSSAFAELLLLDEFLRTGWTTLECRLFWSDLNLALMEGWDREGNAVMSVIRGRTGHETNLTLRLTPKPNQKSLQGAEEDGGAGRAAAAEAEYIIFRGASFLDEWMKCGTLRRIQPLTPDVVTKVLCATEQLANTLAFPSSGGRTSTARNVLQLWLHVPLSQCLLTGKEVAFFMTKDIQLDAAALRLPALLSSLKGSGKAIAYLSSAEMVHRLPLPIVKEWMTRTSPLELYLTRDGRVCSRAALASPLPATAAGGGGAAPLSADVWATLRASGEATETVLLSRNLQRFSNLRGATWADAAFSMADLTALLHATQMRYMVTYFSPEANTASPTTATTTASGQLTSGGGVRPELYSIPMKEWLLRVAHRLLFAPLSRNAARVAGEANTSAGLRSSQTEKDRGEEEEDDAVLDADPEAPLEALVTLYLNLRSASVPQSRGQPRENPSGHSGRSSSTVTIATLNRARFDTALRCCRVRCASVLHARLSRTAEAAAGGGGADAAATAASWSAQTLLELSMLIESTYANLLSDTPLDSSADEKEAALPRLLAAHFKAELQTQLSRWPLHDLSVVLSNQLWWTTRRHGAAVSAAVAAAVEELSWVEEALLDTMEERLVTPREGELSGAVTAAEPFATHEWVLLPFYVRLEQRRQSRASKASAATTLTPSAASPMHAVDDFIELEEALGGGAGAGVQAASLSAPVVPAALSATPNVPLCFSSLVVLERALNAVVAQCHSFDTLLHVVRCLFLSHPATLTTAPDAAAQLSPAVGLFGHVLPSVPHLSPTSTHGLEAAKKPVSRTSELQRDVAQLAVQWVVLPASLRERYVETLYRAFLRLVQLPPTTLGDILEWLHILWLADPQLSRSGVPPSAAFAREGDDSRLNRHGTAGRRERKSGTGARAAATGAQAWPSLFTRCANYLAAALRTGLHTRDGGDAVEFSSSDDASRGVAVPPAIRTLYRFLQSENIYIMAQSLGSDRESGLAAAQLAPTAVLDFLGTLVTQVRADRARGGAARTSDSDPPPLSPAQRALLDLLHPFVMYTIVTAGVFVGDSASAFLPHLLAVLIELDPRMAIAAIQITTAGAGTRGGERLWNRSYLPETAAGFASRVPASISEALRERSVRRLQAIVSALLLLEEQSATLAKEHTQADTMALLSAAATAVAEGDEAGDLSADSDADGAAQTMGRVAVVSGPHRRAAKFLMAELNDLIRYPMKWRLLSHLDADSVQRLLLLRIVRAHPKIWLLLRRNVLSLVTEAVEPPAAAGTDATAPQPSYLSAAQAGLAYDTQQRRLTPTGLHLLQTLPLPLLREFLYEHVRYSFYTSFIHRERVLDQMRRETRPDTFATVPLGRDKSIFFSRVAAPHLWGDGKLPPFFAFTYARYMRSGVAAKLSGTLLLLEPSEARHIAEHVFAPTLLLTLTAELMQLLWWGRRDAGGGETAGQPANLPHAAAAAAMKGSESGETSQSVSYAVLCRCASPRSVLRDAALQPFLVAACTLLDRLASGDATDFLAVLSRDAEWRRAVRSGGPTRQCDDEDAACQKEKQLVVLDWKPITRLLHMMFHVDPGLRECLEWEASRSASAAQTFPRGEEKLDCFHGGLAAVLRRVGELWSSVAASPTDANADTSLNTTYAAFAAATPSALSSAPVLLVVNFGSVLDFCVPYLGSSGGARVSPQRGRDGFCGELAAAAPTSGVTGEQISVRARLTSEHAQWLDAGSIGGRAGAGVNSCYLLTAADFQLYPVVHTIRASTATAAVLRNCVPSAATLTPRLLRHAALLQRAGLRLSARDAEDRCGGSRGKRAENTEEAEEAASTADCWSVRHARLQRCVVEAVFPSSPADTAARAPPAPECFASVEQDCCTAESELERQARGRLELMRCGDVARLLHLLLSQRDHATDSQGAFTSPVRSSRIRVILQTLHDLLPSASPEEVVSVVENLLKDYVVLSETSPAPQSPTTPASHDVFEIRRLLSSVGVLLANDVERFTREQLVWLLTRLHTPQLRRAAFGEAGRDAALDVSHSFLSAAVARSIAMEFADVSDAAGEVVRGPGVAAHRVTVSEWMAAVSAAEARPTAAEVRSVLSLVEATAL